MPSSPDPQSHLLDEILDRAARDPAFRASLLVDPAAAILQAFGVEIPASYRVQFIEKQDGVDALIVLPDAEADGELSDAQLEDVAGGRLVDPTDPIAPPPSFWAS